MLKEAKEVAVKGVKSYNKVADAVNKTVDASQNNVRGKIADDLENTIVDSINKLMGLNEDQKSDVKKTMKKERKPLKLTPINIAAIDPRLAENNAKQNQHQAGDDGYQF